MAREKRRLKPAGKRSKYVSVAFKSGGDEVHQKSIKRKLIKPRDKKKNPPSGPARLKLGENFMMRKHKKVFVKKGGIPDRKYAKARRAAQPVVAPKPDKKDRIKACKEKLRLVCMHEGHRNKIRVRMNRDPDIAKCRTLVADKGSSKYVACHNKKKKKPKAGEISYNKTYYTKTRPGPRA